MKKIILCLVFCVVALSGRAQSGFQPGYVVTLAGDTLQGEVEARTAHGNSQLSRFRPNSQAAVTEYRPAQLLGYGFTHNRLYQSGLVVLQDSVSGAWPASAGPTSSGARPAFLEVLVLGPATLLYLRDNNYNDRYYIRMQSDKVVQELQAGVSTSQVKGIKYEQQSDAYKHTLAAALKSCLVVQPAINTLRYTETELIKLIKRYNECLGEPSLEPASARRKDLWQVNLVGGGQQSELHYLTPTAQNRLPGTVGPIVGVALQVSMARINRAVAARIEALYNTSRYTGTYDYTTAFGPVHQELRTHLTSIYVPVSLRYTLPRGLIRPFVEAGYTLSYFVKADNELRSRTTSGNFASDYTPWAAIIAIPRTFEQGLLGGIGVGTARADARNLSLTLRYTRTNGFGVDESLFVRVHRYFLLLSYDLTK